MSHILIRPSHSCSLWNSCEIRPLQAVWLTFRVRGIENVSGICWCSIPCCNSTLLRHIYDKYKTFSSLTKWILLVIFLYLCQFSIEENNGLILNFFHSVLLPPLASWNGFSNSVGHCLLYLMSQESQLCVVLNITKWYLCNI